MPVWAFGGGEGVLFGRVSKVVKKKKKVGVPLRPARFPSRAPLPLPQPFCRPVRRVFDLFRLFLTSSGCFQRIARCSGDVVCRRSHFGHSGHVLTCRGSRRVVLGGGWQGMAGNGGSDSRWW